LENLITDMHSDNEADEEEKELVPDGNNLGAIL
jgi:hypothetical protein